MVVWREESERRSDRNGQPEYDLICTVCGNLNSLLVTSHAVTSCAYISVCLYRLCVDD